MLINGDSKEDTGLTLKNCQFTRALVVVLALDCDMLLSLHVLLQLNPRHPNQVRTLDPTERMAASIFHVVAADA